MLNQGKQQKTTVTEHLRGGEGSVSMHHLIPSQASCGKFKMCAVLTLEPGCTIGEHTHMPDAEFCWLLEGKLVIKDGDEEHIVYPGDAWICGDGDSHYTKNCFKEKAVFLAIVVN